MGRNEIREPNFFSEESNKIEYSKTSRRWKSLRGAKVGVRKKCIYKPYILSISSKKDLDKEVEWFE